MINSQISVLFWYYLRSFLLQHIRANTVTHSQTLYREWETLNHFSIRGMCPWNSCLWASRNSIKQEVDGGHEEKKALRINRNKALMNSQRRKQHRHGVQGSAFSAVYLIRSSLMSLWDCWVCDWVDLWFLCSLLDFFPTIGLSCPTLMQ